jgi:ADP-ribose pyrophosphatase YjhB (NUDIX family)
MELLEECGVTIADTAWSVLAVTNDVFERELHYVTIFVVARIDDIALRSLQNMEPDKCRGWAWLTLAELKERRVFLSLSNFISGNSRALEELFAAQ